MSNETLHGILMSLEQLTLICVSIAITGLRRHLLTHKITEHFNGRGAEPGVVIIGIGVDLNLPFVNFS